MSSSKKIGAFGKTSIIIFNLVVNIALAAVLYLSLSYYLAGELFLFITGLLLFISLTVFQCYQIVKFVERTVMMRYS